MFFSRHQLNEALIALDLAQRTQPCPEPRRTDVQEQWNTIGEFEVVDVPKPEFIKVKGKKRRTNAEPLPNPHGRAFLTVDPETLNIRCAACDAKESAK